MHLYCAVFAVNALIASVFAQANAPLRTHSISMPFIDDELQSRWFDFGGDTIINTNRYIRLTNDLPSQVGYLWSRLPLVATNFEIEFEFDVHGTEGHLYGDGFAVWLSKQRTMPGTVFGSVDHFEGLGIFFDTYDNERAHRHSFPYISSMLGDGMKSYENDKDGHSTELAGCEADFRNRDFPTRARITYHKGNYLKLDVIVESEDTWTECFKVYDIQLPDQIYLGFTSHTGELTDSHDIISVATKSLTPEQRVYKPAEPSRKVKKGGGFFMFLFKMIAAGGLVGVLYLAYRLYDGKNNLKRF